MTRHAGGAAPGPDVGAAQMRSALLRLSTRIAEAQTEDDVCRGVATGLRHDAFGFDGVGVRERGADAALLASDDDEAARTALLADVRSAVAARISVP